MGVIIVVRWVRVAATLAWSLFFLSFGSRIAYADDGVNLVDSFAGGIDTLVRPEQVTSDEVTPELEFDTEYEPNIMSASEYTVDGEGDLNGLVELSQIRGVVQQVNAPKFNGTAAHTLYYWVRTLVLNTNFIGICVGLVFMWWGVRKCVRMLMAAFRAKRGMSV